MDIIEPRRVLTLSHVSRAWRSILLSLTDVFATSPDWDYWPLWLCRDWYKRANGRPITIHVSFDFFDRISNGSNGPQLLQAVLEFAPQAKSLTISSPVEREVFWDMMTNPLFSRLSHLELINVNLPVLLPSQICANLRSLILDDSSVLPQDPNGENHHFESLEYLRVSLTNNMPHGRPWAFIVRSSPKMSNLLFTRHEDSSNRLPDLNSNNNMQRDVSSAQTLAFHALHPDDVHRMLTQWFFSDVKKVILDRLEDDAGEWSCHETLATLARETPDIRSLEVISHGLGIRSFVGALRNNPGFLPNLVDLVLDVDHAKESALDEEILELAKLRRLERLQLCFSPSENVVLEPRKRVNVLDNFAESWIAHGPHRILSFYHSVFLSLC
ncbi:hypothetical protein DL93DRAFT_2073428, partial [Clavulina sp. PMI_390]